MTEVMAEKDFWVSSHPGFVEALGPGQPAWLAELRRRGLERFAELGFPHTRLEDWRHTSVAALARTPFRPASGEEGAAALSAGRLASLLPGGAGAARLVFVNGGAAPALSAPGSLPPGVIATSLRAALESGLEPLEELLSGGRGGDGNPFAALNDAFLRDGGVLVVPEGVRLEAPIHLVYVSAPGDGPLRAHPRTLILAGRDSQVTVIETHAGLDDGLHFTNPAATLVAGENAVVDHVRVQRDGEGTFHVATTEIRQARSSTVRSLHLTLGAQLCRHDLRLSLEGEGAEGTLHGLYLVHGHQHVDHHTTVDHRVPHTRSDEFFKGVLAGRGRGVFNGRVIVRPDAQKTDAQQRNRNLLLSDDVEIHTQPQLEIHADDVKCSHGATIGRLDRDALFYLCSRGLEPTEARRLLTWAFAAEMLAGARPDPVREGLEALVRERLALDALPGGAA